MTTKFKVGDEVTDYYGDTYTIKKVRLDVDGIPIYTGTYADGYMLFRDTEISLTNLKPVLS